MLSILNLIVVIAAEPALPSAKVVTAEHFRGHVGYLSDDERGGRDVGSPGGTAAAEYIREKLKAAGAVGLGKDHSWFQEFPFRTKAGEVTARNVVGIIPGAGKFAGEAIVISSHHDHIGVNEKLKTQGKDGIFNGADDNASGCAGLLLVAEAMKADVDKLPADRRAVIFASFDAEERGLVGSRYYTEHPLYPLENTVANLNFDMIGRLDRDKLYVGDGKSSLHLAQRVTDLGSALGLRVDTRGGGIRRADHVNFLDREIPAMHFLTGIHSDYHQVGDEAKKINAEGGAKVATLAYQLLREIMTLPGRPKFRRTDLDIDLNAGIRLVQTLGIFPEMNTQAGRYPLLRFVLPGSPAAKHGLQSGDEIIEINGQEFERVEDAGIMLAEADLKKGMKLKVRRKQEKLDLTLPGEIFAAFSGPDIKAKDAGKFDVTFRFKPSGKPKTVHLTGTFNKWNPSAIGMNGPNEKGEFTHTMELVGGIYEYKFIVDGKEWMIDPTNMRVTGRFQNSVVIVGKPE